MLRGLSQGSLQNGGSTIWHQAMYKYRPSISSFSLDSETAVENFLDEQNSPPESDAPAKTRLVGSSDPDGMRTCLVHLTDYDSPFL